MKGEKEMIKHFFVEGSMDPGYPKKTGGIEAIFSDYHYHNWSGRGESIIKHLDGTWSRQCHSHCSCNGPWDGLDYGNECDLEDYLRGCSPELLADLDGVLKLVKMYLSGEDLSSFEH